MQTVVNNNVKYFKNKTNYFCIDFSKYCLLQTHIFPGLLPQQTFEHGSA